MFDRSLAISGWTAWAVLVGATLLSACHGEPVGLEWVDAAPSPAGNGSLPGDLSQDSAEDIDTGRSSETVTEPNPDVEGPAADDESQVTSSLTSASEGEPESIPGSGVAGGTFSDNSASTSSGSDSLAAGAAGGDSSSSGGAGGLSAGNGGDSSSAGGDGGSAGLDGATASGGRAGNAGGGAGNGGTAPMFATVQEAIDAADDGAVIQLGPELTTENVTVSAKQLTLRCDASGSRAHWTCANKFSRLLTVSAGASVTLEGCVIEDCNGGIEDTYNSGAIVPLDAAYIEVRGCIFRNNASHRGPVFGTFPAGQVRASGTFALVDNIMVDNFADDAGVIYVNDSTQIILRNNLIYNNSAFDYSAAVWLRDQVRSMLIFEKNVIYNNTAARAAALETFAGEGPIVNSSIVLGNTPEQMAPSFGAAFSQVSGAHPFVNPEQGDFSLRPGTAAIDAGDPSLPLDSDGTRTDQGVDWDALPSE